MGLEFCLDSCTINNLSYIGYMGLWVNSDSEANVCVLCAPSLAKTITNAPKQSFSIYEYFHCRKYCKKYSK